MYRTKAKINIILSIFFKILLLMIGIIVRRFLVNHLGTEITGLYSLFISILGFLSVAELGVGSAIVFSMYKPIIDEDFDKVSGLYHLYRKIYKYIYWIIITIGILITPFIPLLTKDTTITNSSIYITYLLFLISTAMTYLYAYKSSYINANMDNYVTNSIRSIFQITEYILQIIFIIVTRSFFVFLIILFMSNLMQWITTNLVFKRKYAFKLNDTTFLPEEIIKEVKKKTKAMFSHKIGGLLVNSIESVIISTFIGLSVLGVYSNYVLITTSIIGILSLFFSSITTVIGQAYAKIDKKIISEKFENIYVVNYIIGFIVFMGFFYISSDLITILFNEDVILSRGLIAVMTINYFIQFMRQSVLSFRDATGTFYHDRFKPIFEGILNLALSLIFVNYFGLIGVLLATIITNITITHTVEPYVLYKYAFELSPKKQYIRDYLGIIIFSTVILGSWLFESDFNTNIYLNLLFKGLLSVFISSIVLSILYIISHSFRKGCKWIFYEMQIVLNRK